MQYVNRCKIHHAENYQKLSVFFLYFIGVHCSWIRYQIVCTCKFHLVLWNINYYIYNFQSKVLTRCLARCFIMCNVLIYYLLVHKEVNVIPFRSIVAYHDEKQPPVEVFYHKSFYIYSEPSSDDWGGIMWCSGMNWIHYITSTSKPHAHITTLFCR